MESARPLPIVLALLVAVLLPLPVGAQDRSADSGEQSGGGQPSAAPGALPVEQIADVVVDRDRNTVPDRKGERVHVRGVVTIPTGLLRSDGLQIAIQDRSGGIGLYSRDFQADLAYGDVVEAIGEVTQFKGAIQLRDAVVRRVDSGPVPAAQPVTIAEADSWAHMGRRIRIEGVTGALSLDDFGLLRLTGDDGGVVTLFIPSAITHTFEWKDYPRGTRVSASGVLSIYKPTWPYNGGFQLIVTSPADLTVLEPARPAWLAWAMWILAAAIAVVALALLAFQLVHRRQKARDRELKTLAALSSAFATPELSERQLARHACEILIAYRIAEAVVVQGFDDHGLLRDWANSSAVPALGASFWSANGDHVPGHVGDAYDTPIAARAAATGLRLLAAHPLLAQSGALGFLTALSSRRRRPSQMQERTLLSAAKLLAMALENTRIQQRARIEQQELQQLVITDGLTGLHNRRFLDEYLRVQIPLAQRRDGGLALLAIDVDHFKRINDSYGHEVGDRVLTGIAALLRQAGRSCDLPVRLGGEEFVFVIAERDVDGAVAFAERLRSGVAAHRFDSVVPGTVLEVTVSIGVAVFGMHGEDAPGLLRASDEAMYASKRQGRNRTTLAGGSPALDPDAATAVPTA